jgi:hypothetical protein
MKAMDSVGGGRHAWRVRIHLPAPDGCFLRMLPIRRVVRARPEPAGVPAARNGETPFPMLDDGQMLLPGVAEPRRWTFGTSG